MNPELEDLIATIVNYLSRERYHGFSSLLSPDLIDSLSYELADEIECSGYNYGISENELNVQYDRGFEDGYEEGKRDGYDDATFELTVKS